MKAFLKTVAQDMLAKYGADMSDIAIGFPKQACSALPQYLSGAIGRQADLDSHIHHHQRPLPPTLRPEGC